MKVLPIFLYLSYSILSMFLSCLILYNRSRTWHGCCDGKRDGLSPFNVLADALKNDVEALV